MACFELLGDLALALDQTSYSKQLEPIFIQYLTNTAASVREMGVIKVGEIAERFRADWAVKDFIPKVVESYNAEQQGYNYRMTAIKSLAAVMPVLQKDQITELVVPIFVKACGDTVPNVQFCVAKTISERHSLFDPSIFASQLAPKLKDMTQEPDKDVAYFAHVALNADSSDKQ